jgi:hypothetical protein
MMMKTIAVAVIALQGGGAPADTSAFPFAVGEKLTYTAKLGLISLGSGTLEVAAKDSIRGDETFRFRFRLRGKTVFYSLDDVLESWVGTGDFISRRFVQDFVENDKPRHRTYEIYADSGFFREVGKEKTEPTPADPLDDAAFFYFVRITPLAVGKKYVYPRYFRKDKNPVTIEVTKREKMGLPDGSEVNCLVLHPVIDTQGLFSKRSDTRIWLTDDSRRIPVQIRTKFPFGTITLRLKEMVLAGSTAPAPASGE